MWRQQLEYTSGLAQFKKSLLRSFVRGTIFFLRNYALDLNGQLSGKHGKVPGSLGGLRTLRRRVDRRPEELGEPGSRQSSSLQSHCGPDQRYLWDLEPNETSQETFELSF